MDDSKLLELAMDLEPILHKYPHDLSTLSVLHRINRVVQDLREGVGGVYIESLGGGYFVKLDCLRTNKYKWTAIGVYGRLGPDVMTRKEAIEQINKDFYRT